LLLTQQGFLFLDRQKLAFGRDRKEKDRGHAFSGQGFFFAKAPF